MGATDESFGLSLIEGGKAKKRSRGRPHGSQTFMQRFEERWRRRRDDNGGL